MRLKQQAATSGQRSEKSRSRARKTNSKTLAIVAKSTGKGQEAKDAGEQSEDRECDGIPEHGTLSILMRRTGAHRERGPPQDS